MSTKQRSPRKKLLQFDFQMKMQELQWDNEEYYEREEPKRGVARHHSWGSTSSTDSNNSNASSSSSVSSILRNNNKKDRNVNQHEEESKSVSWKGTVRQRIYPRIPESQIPNLFYDRYDIEQFREDAYFETRFAVDYPELYDELEM